MPRIPLFRSAFPLDGIPVTPEQILEFHRVAFGDARMDGEATAATATATEPTAAVEPPAAQTAQPEAKTDVWDDPAKAKTEIERLRRENAAERTNAKTKAADEARAELAQTIGKALSLVQDDKAQVDPAALVTQVSDLTGQARALQIENAILRQASKHGADPGALTDSRAFLASVADLDPSAADFGAQVGEAIKAAVAANPKLSATAPVVGASTVQHAGGSGEGKVTKGQFDRMTVAQKTALYESDPETYTRLLGI